jgi:rRNA maturation endonuclease Nob1
MPDEDLAATLFRLDVDRIRAVRRAASGTTRCPECDAVNPADRRFCKACGSKLYPVEEHNERMHVYEKLTGKDKGD